MSNAKVKSKKTGAIFVISTDDFDEKKHDLLLSPTDEPVTPKDQIKVEVVVVEDEAPSEVKTGTVCDVCGREFKNANGLRLHNKTHATTAS